MASIDAIESARLRRTERASQSTVEIEWFIRQVTSTIELSMYQRMRMATQYLQDRVVMNISRPVTKSRIAGKIVVSNRSRPGEFPKADTTQLMKTIFGDVIQNDRGINGYVGTPLDYGLILETQMNRSFLVRTLREESDNLRRILTGPITGGVVTSFRMM